MMLLSPPTLIKYSVANYFKQKRFLELPLALICSQQLRNKAGNIDSNAASTSLFSGIVSKHNNRKTKKSITLQREHRTRWHTVLTTWMWRNLSVWDSPLSVFEWPSFSARANTSLLRWQFHFADSGADRVHATLSQGVNIYTYELMVWWPKRLFHYEAFGGGALSFIWSATCRV